MRLRVKDLRQYLLLRNIPTDTCREKEDLVDLVLVHQGAESDDGDEEPDTPTLQSRPLYEPPPAALEPPVSSPAQISPVNASQGEAISRSNSSGSTNQVRGLTDCSGCSFVFLESYWPLVLSLCSSM